MLFYLYLMIVLSLVFREVCKFQKWNILHREKLQDESQKEQRKFVF